MFVTLITENHYFYDWAIWTIPDGFGVSAELSLDAHPVNNWSEGLQNALAVEYITASLSLDTHPGELVHIEQDDEHLLTMVNEDTVKCDNQKLKIQNFSWAPNISHENCYCFFWHSCFVLHEGIPSVN